MWPESKGSAVEIHEKLSDGSSRGRGAVKVFLFVCVSLALWLSQKLLFNNGSRLVSCRCRCDGGDSALAQLFGFPKMCGGVGSVAQKL